jgi:D-glutamate cyclase
MPKILAEYVDRLCSIEMRRQGMPRGTHRPLYEAAYAKVGEPLSYSAAQLLLDHCKPGAPVFITCAAGGPPWLPNGESDGPPGGAALARALTVATGAVPMFVSSDYQAPPIAASARGQGLVIVDPDVALKRTWAGAVLEYNEVGDGTGAANVLFDRYQPTAIIAIETLGPNPAGVTHSVLGHPIQDAPAYHSLFEVATQRGIVSVGIGDGGNEIGFGNIIDSVHVIQKYGAKCQCPCGQGMATVVKTTITVAAGVSNWGAYGVAAMIAFLSGKLDALHDSDTERRVLEWCYAAGAVDGSFANHGWTVDGIDARISLDLVNMLATMIKMAGQSTHRTF